MTIKDIVNRDIATLTTCEAEPIHIPGSIQPHGFLFGLTSDFTIAFCSGNTASFLGLSHEQLLEKNFQVVFGEEAADALRTYPLSQQQSFAPPLHLQLLNLPFDCILQPSSNGILVAEFEPHNEEILSVNEVYRQTAQFTAYLQKNGTLRDLCQRVAEETRALTGYDRVMVYRFDEHYNGEVFAESCAKGIEPYLGLHYPHTDIPVQARELYRKNLLRLIADVNYAPVPIYTTNGTATNATLDLGFSSLRSVSPIHVQYLQNMGVGATLTLSLLQEGRLWGLIACHHSLPKKLGYNALMSAQLQAHFLTSQISVREIAEEYASAKNISRRTDELLSTLFATETTTIEEIVQNEAMLSFADATGVAVQIEDVVYTNGAVPPEAELRKLSQWIEAMSDHKGFSSEKLATAYAAARDWCAAVSGVIYHSLGDGNGFFLFREEVLRIIKWAGNPEKPVGKNAGRLSPRQSFAVWKETKACESKPWLKPELAAAASVAKALQRHVYLLQLRREEERQRKLSEKLREANAELENINWIGSHDLKEPLRKIQVFSSLILAQDNTTTTRQIVDYVSRMNESAKRMHDLIADILAYSRLNHIDEGKVSVSLENIVHAIVQEQSFEAAQKEAVLEIAPLPNVQGIPVLLRQLFTNLLSNALKFSAPGVRTHIRISAEKANALLPGENALRSFNRIAVADNGIGFDEALKEKIFQVFKRLHSDREYSGTGVGLALSKKIMQNHGGFIDVTSKVGQGTTFWLYFPVNG